MTRISIRATLTAPREPAFDHAGRYRWRGICGCLRPVLGLRWIMSYSVPVTGMVSAARDSCGNRMC